MRHLFGKGDFGARLLLLVLFFFFGFAIFGLVVKRSFDQVKVSGPIYQEIVSRKDVIADVLPPPLYVIESYLLARKLFDSADVAAKDALRARIEQLRLEFEQAQTRWRAELPIGELKSLLTERSYASALAFYAAYDSKLLPALDSSDSVAASAALVLLDKKYEIHRAAVDQVVTLAKSQYQSTEAFAKAEISRQMQLFMAIGAGLLFLVALMALAAWQMTRKLRSRIALASEVAGKIAAGNLTTEIPLSDDNDETSQLLEAIQKMSHSLRALVTRAKQSSIELMSTATEYAATSRQQEATVQGFGASTSQIAAAAKQISATSSELLHTMNDVNVVAGNAASLAEQGQIGLKSLDKTMDKLATVATTMTTRLAAIREEASEITSVVTTISKVADQTNLLSINAAIEAEKAGEQGLGFLVLAREIRRLADQTAVASLDIEQMIKQMQTAVSAGVMEIDRFAEEVRAGVGGVAHVGDQFRQIITDVKSLSERFDAVNMGMRAQSQGARQIGESMSQLTDGARQTSISLREFNGATESLRDAVASLKHEITQFNVGD